MIFFIKSRSPTETYTTGTTTEGSMYIDDSEV